MGSYLDRPPSHVDDGSNWQWHLRTGKSVFTFSKMASPFFADLHCNKPLTFGHPPSFDTDPNVVIVATITKRHGGILLGSSEDAGLIRQSARSCERIVSAAVLNNNVSTPVIIKVHPFSRYGCTLAGVSPKIPRGIFAARQTEMT